MIRTIPSKIYKSALLFNLEYAFNSYSKYVDLVEEHFETLINQHEVSYQELLEDMKVHPEKYTNPDFVDYLHESAYDEMIVIDREFKIRFRESLVLQVYSFMEFELRKHCEVMKRMTEPDFSMDDLKGDSDLHKLKKYYKANFPKDKYDDNLWQFVNNLRKVRNRIVHHNSIIRIDDKDYTSIKDFSKGNFTLKASNQLKVTTYLIILDKDEFVNLCIEKVKGFVFDLMFD